MWGVPGPRKQMLDDSGMFRVSSSILSPESCSYPNMTNDKVASEAEESRSVGAETSPVGFF